MDVPHHDDGRPVAAQADPPSTWQGLVDHVLQALRQGRWSPGDKLPTESQWMASLGLSRSAVNQAMKQLEAQGVVQRYRRRGTFVARLPAMAVSADLSPSPGRAAVSRQVHVLMPASAEHMAMHWGDAAMEQLEATLHAAGLVMDHLAVPAQLKPVDLRRIVASLADTPSRGLVILSHLAVHADDAAALLPHAVELMDYPGRVCWFNRAGRSLQGWPYDAVSLSPLSQGMAVGRYLARYGAARVCCVGLAGADWSRSRVAGVQAVLERLAPKLPLTVHWSQGVRGRAGAACWAELAKAIVHHDGRPTLVVPNDVIAVEALTALQRHGLHCPTDYSLISFDNHAPCRPYNITTAAPLAQEVGQTIGRLMTDQLDRPGRAAIHLTLPCMIIERATFSPALGRPSSSDEA